MKKTKLTADNLKDECNKFTKSLQMQLKDFLDECSELSNDGYFIGNIGCNIAGNFVMANLLLVARVGHRKQLLADIHNSVVKVIEEREFLDGLRVANDEESLH